MYKYSFKTKEVKHILDDVQLVVSNNAGVNLPCPVEKLSVIEMFDNKQQFIAAPAEEMPEVIIETMSTPTDDNYCTGKMVFNGRRVNFSLHEGGTILYVRKY